MRRVRLVIADRRPIVLQGFASLFAAQTDFELVASCLNGASCLEAIRKLRPDVVLAEDGFSDVTPSEMLAVVSAEHLPTRLVLYTASVARGDLAAAITAGACSAISMRERPERVMQSLRLVAARPDQARVGEEENGALAANALSILTGQEREIMRLVARGLSNQAIARQLNVSLSTIKVRLKHMFEKLEVNNRSELTLLARSQRYGALGVLAAVIFAALDDDRAASLNSVDAGHVLTDTFTVMAADGTHEVVTISINRPKESADAPGIMAKAMTKARNAANAVPKTPISTSKLVESSIEIGGNTFTSAASNAPRSSAGTYGAFMMAAAAVWLYLVDGIHSVAKALDPSDGLADLSASATASGTKELATLALASKAAASSDSHDNPVSLNSSTHDWLSAFGTPRGDTAGFDKIQMIDANAADAVTGGKDDSHQFATDADTIGAGSVTVNALAGHTTDRGDSSETTATDASQHLKDNTTPSAGDDSDRSQSQRDSHASEHGLAAPGQQAEHHATTGSDGNPGHDPHASEEGSAADKQHGKNDAPGGESDHGQPQRDLHASEHGPAAAGQNGAHHATPRTEANPGHDQHASENGSAAAEQHAKHDTTPESDVDPGHSQHNLHTAPVNDSNNPHSESSMNAGGKDQALGDGSQAQTPATLLLGDSFHFKNEMASSKAPDIFELHAEYGPAPTEHDEHAARHDGLTSIHATDLTSLSLGEHNNFDHAKGVDHHMTHDLIV